DAKAIEQMKDGVRIVNCARGGLIVEADLASAIESGKVAGAAIDVFEVEPATDSVLFGLPNVVCTPHLGAATSEAQENVALQVAEQMSAYLTRGAVTNALNMPSISAEEAPRLTPFVKLADTLGSFVGQVTDDPIRKVEILYDGHVASMNIKALSSAVLAGLLRAQVSDVNMVSAPVMASERGMQLLEMTREKSGVFDGYIQLNVVTNQITRSIAGTVFSDGKPRFIQIKGVNMEAEAGEHMLYTTNRDVPGIVGKLGGMFAESEINIANFYLGRNHAGGDAIALVQLDQPAPAKFLKLLAEAPEIETAKPLEFAI
ncbi:MAG: NAD(P)-dependent oxidoreductase, partial [Rhizobiaceae bacterium]